MADAPSGVDPRTGVHYPLHEQKPRWIDNYIKVAVNELGKLVIPKYASAAARDAAIPQPVSGDFAWLSNGSILTAYVSGSDAGWKQVYPPVVPKITYGTAAPTGGANGDIYFQVV